MMSASGWSRPLRTDQVRAEPLLQERRDLALDVAPCTAAEFSSIDEDEERQADLGDEQRRHAKLARPPRQLA